MKQRLIRYMSNRNEMSIISIDDRYVRLIGFLQFVLL